MKFTGKFVRLFYFKLGLHYSVLWISVLEE